MARAEPPEPTETPGHGPPPGHAALAEPDWPTCIINLTPGEACTGVRAGRFDRCLAHLQAGELDEVLSTLRPEADLDARGTTITADLLSELLGRFYAPREDIIAGGLRLGAADFRRARFPDDAAFARLAVKGAAAFDGARFDGCARFSDATFYGTASFAGAGFGGTIEFSDTSFRLWTSFDQSVFHGGVTFSGTTFHTSVSFRGARFESAEQFGPVVAGEVMMDDAVFRQRVEVRLCTSVAQARRVRFEHGSALRLRYAVTDLTDAVLGPQATLAGSPQPYEGEGYGGVADLYGGIADRNIGFIAKKMRAGVSGLLPEGAAETLWVPVIESLRGVDAADLVIIDTDLSACLFSGTYNLGSLRMEGRCRFRYPPAPRPKWSPLRLDHQWLPARDRAWRRLRLTRRQLLAEECIWRGWPAYAAPRAYRAEEVAPELSPERLAALYRALRTALEDVKNEPGAADFYYGEMEMRRKSRSAPAAERLILLLYWAISGYGLRATRALTTLAVLVVGAAAALRVAGFPGHPVGYLDSLLYAAGAVLSLDLTGPHIPAALTHWGDVIRILLRVAGPVCLGLAALALRGRVKR